MCYDYDEFMSMLDGQLLLTKPNTVKTSTIEANEQLAVCIASMQGWRLTMEDTSCLHLPIQNDDTNTTFVGVFDGHGGTNVADYVSKHLHKFIVRQPEYKDNLKKAIVKGFMEIDSKLKRDHPEDQSGSTACTIFIRNKMLYCSNLGDSRAIAYENGKVVPLSYDHKPTIPLEYKRIIEAGSWVEAERVNGTLALSRAFGDFQFKNAPYLRPEQQAVSCVPDIVTKKLDKYWKFVVIACDGIWEVMSNERVGDFVKRRLSDGMQIDKVCESLMSACLAPRTDGLCLGCDNMTVSIILFKWPEK
ncbi:probable protein phosphatase 2C T23F11.1 isoform X1 [Rhodnius prolixus]|uniref:probable protein phosphatase 2C T23F11.1 isoform X1 n=1 Tax=Rhodnius prolixus TaxID=13249 RepID=UPI003D189B16